MSHPSATLATEMDTAVWTAIGLLAATSLGSLFYLGSRIDALGARIGALADGTASRFDHVDARIDALADGTASRLDSLAARMDAGFARVDARFDAIEARLDAHIDRHAS